MLNFQILQYLAYIAQCTMHRYTHQQLSASIPNCSKLTQSFHGLQKLRILGDAPRQAEVLLRKATDVSYIS